MHDRSISCLGQTAIAFTTLVALTSFAHANDSAPPSDSALTRYKRNQLSTRLSIFGGLKLMRNGAKLDVGFFGGNRHQIFASSPSALEAMESYRKLRIAGAVLWGAGMAAMIAELVLLIADHDVLIDKSLSGNSIKPLFWAILVPSTVVGMTGGLMLQGANGYLSDAIEHYNNDLYRRLAAETAGRRIGLSWRTSF